MLRRFRRKIAYAISGLSIGYCTLRYLCGVGKCEDVSMEPSIQHGDVVLLTPFHVTNCSIEKGDVVFCRAPKNARSIVCKRVTGFAGDTMDNDVTGSAEYVGKGHVWLEGDNKDASIDSRTFGAVPYGLLLSKVSLRIWPPSRIGSLKMVEKPRVEEKEV